MKKSYVYFVAAVCTCFFVSCAQLPPIKTVPHEETVKTPKKDGSPNSPTQEIGSDKLPSRNLTPVQLTKEELEKYAYEIGLDPKKELTEEEKKQIENRKRVRTLERSLDSQKERLQYSKVLPWFKNDDEKLDYLTIPSIEGRQAWINRNKIWTRAKNLKGFVDVMESQDIAVGMPADYVRKSWGEPTNIEASGNPIYKNERWKYLKQVSTPQGYRQEKRYIYFEGGRVVGWETE